jgi:1-acyl-sn-glycerol-3-phosphate acyltransferase
MIVYALLRSLAGLALRWFYRRIDVEGLDRLPSKAPTLLVVNHPNALIDALLVGCAIPRRVTLTAKATLFQNPLLARFLGWVGVVPLVRASDVRDIGGSAAPVDPNRNARAFGALRRVLHRGGAVVIFPEGISHDNPSLAPLRTGAARIALDARDEAGVRNLQIVPIGLTFERKDAPRSRVVVQIGHPISLDEWHADDDSPVIALTHEIETRLRAVTLNYHTPDDASRAAALSSVFASLLTDELAPLGNTRAYAIEVSLARRIADARDALMRSRDEQLRARADHLLRALAAFEMRLARHRVAIDEIHISTEGRNAARFVFREGWLIAIAGPAAVWGWLNHWIPFHAARAIAMRRVESASDPAMRTILAGASLVVAFYAAQGAMVAWLGGWIAALLYVASLPITADVNFLLRERLRRAVRRARTYLLFRRRPKLHASLQQELQLLRVEALEIERQLQIATASEATA